jgi:hypothetical protein
MWTFKVPLFLFFAGVLSGAFIPHPVLGPASFALLSLSYFTLFGLKVEN